MLLKSIVLNMVYLSLEFNQKTYKFYTRLKNTTNNYLVVFKEVKKEFI